MKLFYWLPFVDSSWHLDVLRSMESNSYILPFHNGTQAGQGYYGLNRQNGQWEQVTARDCLIIAGHGRIVTTNMITWIGKNEKISWTAEQLASNLSMKLSASVKFRGMDIQLLVCFGANSITPLAPSFAQRLSTELGKRAFHRGLVSGLRGATGMYASRGFQTGTGRLSASRYLLAHNFQSANSGILTRGSFVSFPISGTNQTTSCWGNISG